MKLLSNSRYAGMLALALFMQNCSQSSKTSSDANGADTTYYSMEDFRKVEKYDTHTHINAFDTTFIDLAKEDNFRLLALNVNPSSYPTVEHQQDVAVRVVKAYPCHKHWLI
jgi:hypothetical protein